MRLHFEVAPRDVEFRFLCFKLKFGAIEGQDKVLQFEITLLAADLCPLLIGSDERTIKAGGDFLLEEQFAREIGRHWHRTTMATELRDDSSAGLGGHLPVHRPQRESDAIPAQVPKATQRFKSTIRANISGEELRC